MVTFSILSVVAFLHMVDMIYLLMSLHTPRSHIIPYDDHIKSGRIDEYDVIMGMRSSCCLDR